MDNPYAKAKRIKHPQEPLVENFNYALYREDDCYMLEHKQTKRREKITIDAAFFIIQLEVDIVELYAK